MRWRGWKRLPARKPMAVGVVVYSGALLAWYAWNGADIPPGIAGIVQTLIYACVGGYAATSAYEAVRTSPGREEDCGGHE